MTTIYTTKEQALSFGAYYAGHTDEAKQREVIAGATIDSKVIGWPHSRPATEHSPAVEKRVESYEIQNADGETVYLGIDRLRDGYELWLISPEGAAIRT